ncbi:MAG: hypothetical protein NWQ38_01595 [Cellulophaga sp.]|nr:hypothetical protein [Cellulophaga sp.]
MVKVKKNSLLFLWSLFMLSCINEDTQSDWFDISGKIIGEWQQVQAFNLKDASTVPPRFDWDDVANGFSLQLSEDGTFRYTKYGECNTGRYIFNNDLAEIEFQFNCEIIFNGVATNKLTESFAREIKNDFLVLFHAETSEDCETKCNSVLKRIE